MKLRTHNIALRGETVLLRPMTEDDWGVLAAWYSDPEVVYFCEGDDVTSRSPKEVQAIYRGVSRHAFCFIIEIEGRPVGECWLQEMNLPEILEKHPGRDLRRIDITIGEKEFWGRGYGTDAIRTLTGFGFEKERADAIFGCGIADYNGRSRRAFEKSGYRVDQEAPEKPPSKARYRHDLILTRETYFGPG